MIRVAPLIELILTAALLLLQCPQAFAAFVSTQARTVAKSFQKPYSAIGETTVIRTATSTNFIANTLKGVATATSLPIEFQGGDLRPGVTQVVLIWYGAYTPASAAVPIVEKFVQDISGSSWWTIVSTYMDAQQNPLSITYTFLASVFDQYSQGTALDSDAKVQAVVVSTMQALGRIPDRQTLYVVITSPDVREQQLCMPVTGYCGYHTVFAIGQVNLTYSLIGDPTGCDVCFPPQLQLERGRKPPPTATGVRAADGIIFTLAHELIENALDPVPFSAWIDAKEQEAADKCAGVYGQVSKPDDGAPFNTEVGGQKLLLQAVWRADTQSCALSAAAQTAQEETNLEAALGP